MITLLYYFFVICSLLSCGGCRKQPCEQALTIDSKKLTVEPKQVLLNLHAMPDFPPKDIQKRLAWGLWMLDKRIINKSLAEGADPYILDEVVDLSKILTSGEKLSPYTLVLEGYLAQTYLEEDVQNICNKLQDLYNCVDFLLKNHVSVDAGVLTIGSHSSMRKFAYDSIARLNTEKTSQDSFDMEMDCALTTWEKIQILIDKYQ